jgi:hypothetical protein
MNALQWNHTEDIRNEGTMPLELVKVLSTTNTLNLEERADSLCCPATRRNS